MFGNLSSNMLRVTLPTNPVAPMIKMRRSLKISVGESFVIVNSSARSVKFAPPFRAIVFQNVDHGRSAAWGRRVQRGAIAVNSIDIGAAQNQLLDHCAVPVKSGFG